MNIGSNAFRQDFLPVISTFVLKNSVYAYSLQLRNFFPLPQDPHRGKCRMENPA